MRRKSQMVSGMASSVGKSPLSAAVLRNHRINGGRHLVGKSLLCAAVLRSHGVYGGRHLVESRCSTRLLAELREALECTGSR